MAIQNDVREIQPTVNSEAEFLEIVNDFGDPFEIFREAVSNAIDWGATYIKMSCTVEPVQGRDKLVIRISDNGAGMSRSVLDEAFWGLGHSPTRERKKKGKDTYIGEKGHGTKIFLRSECVKVRTQSAEGAFEGICEDPLGSLFEGKLHRPKTWSIDKFLPNTGTEIEIVGYNNNQRARFLQNVVKDYILWFTKAGSIERVFGHERLRDFKIYLKCIGWKDENYEEIPFGHYFPDENSNINKLLKEKEFDAADWYVKRFVWKDQQLIDHPEVTYDVVISVEGDNAKRDYNKLIKDKLRATEKNVGYYRVRDRYGLWICKDFIPVNQVNDWISGFGSGSNAFVLLHGFINCQRLNLTANRGTISNTEPAILDELRARVQDHIAEVDNYLKKDGIYTLIKWQDEIRTKQQEISDFKMRVKKLQSRKVAKLNDTLLFEPTNESELFGLFMTVYALRPDLFEFEPLDYNTTQGIDIIARNKSPKNVVEGDHWYVEFKYILEPRINHSFDNIRWIVCWDFDKNMVPGINLVGIEEDDIRALTTTKTKNSDLPLYFLDGKAKATKIQIIKLKEFFKQMLDLDFQPQK